MIGEDVFINLWEVIIQRVGLLIILATGIILAGCRADEEKWVFDGYYTQPPPDIWILDGSLSLIDAIEGPTDVPETTEESTEPPIDVTSGD